MCPSVPRGSGGLAQHAGDLRPADRARALGGGAPVGQVLLVALERALRPAFHAVALVAGHLGSFLDDPTSYGGDRCGARRRLAPDDPSLPCSQPLRRRWGASLLAYGHGAVSGGRASGRGVRSGHHGSCLHPTRLVPGIVGNPGREAISTDAAPAAIGPYSQAIRAGGWLFCSGQIPLDPASGQLVPGGVAEQTVRVLDNLSAVLAAAGLGLGDVVKTTAFLTTMDD